jgi:hypothetical protein
MAEFAANAAHGHIGRAKHLVKDKEALIRKDFFREVTYKISTLNSAYTSANELYNEIELATKEELQNYKYISTNENVTESENNNSVYKFTKKTSKENEQDLKIKNIRIFNDQVQWFLDENLSRISEYLRFLYLSTNRENEIDKQLNQALIFQEAKNQIKKQKINQYFLESLFVKLYTSLTHDKK